MTTSSFVTTPSEGVNFNLTYSPYDQTAVSSSTNSPDNPGPPFSAGTYMRGTGETDFVFCRASGNLTAGMVCQITTATFDAFGIQTTSATLGNLVGVAVVAITSNQYGWLQRAGKCDGISVAASCAANVPLYATGTIGVVDDANTTGLKNITGMIITVTATSAEVKAGTLNYPVVGATA